MALIHMRIDNRLIHGQVTVAWVGYLGADHIMVVNDKVSQDPIQKQLLPNAARGGKDLGSEYRGSSGVPEFGSRRKRKDHGSGQIPL